MFEKGRLQEGLKFLFYFNENSWLLLKSTNNFRCKNYSLNVEKFKVRFRSVRQIPSREKHFKSNFLFDENGLNTLNDWLKKVSTLPSQSQLNSFRGCEVVLSFVFRRNKFFAFFLFLSTQIEKFVCIENKWIKGNGRGKFKTNITDDNYTFVLHISEDRISFLFVRSFLSNFCSMLFCSINQSMHTVI